MKKRVFAAAALLALALLMSSSVQAQWVTTSKGKMYKTQGSPGYLTGWQTIEGSRYYFTAEGIMVTGKRKLNGTIYYFKKNGKLRTGLQKIGKYTYYFGTEGFRHRGWQTITYKGKTNRYYFKKKNGRMVTGWLKIDGKVYYLDKSGIMKSNCWIVSGDTRYHLGSNGARQKGITKIKGKYYYLSRKDNGKLVYGWISTGGKRYFGHRTKGYLITGLAMIGGKKYYFYASGEMAKNVRLYVGSKEYTINTSGVITNEAKVNIAGTGKGSKIAKFAVQYVGNPYVWGGTSLTNGADCSGFVYTVFQNFGITVPRVADDQMKSSSGKKISSVKNLLPGDLVFYGSTGYASHVAIYIGNNQVVHASNSAPYPQGGIKINEYNYNTPIAYVRYW